MSTLNIESLNETPAFAVYSFNKKMNNKQKKRKILENSNEGIKKAKNQINKQSNVACNHKNAPKKQEKVNLEKVKNKKTISKESKNGKKLEKNESKLVLNTDYSFLSNFGQVNDSMENGRLMFKWLIEPTNPDEFFKDTWEKQPLILKRNYENYYSNILNTKTIDQILRKNSLFFGRNIDITSYTNGVRETLNPEGRAFPATVWDFYSNGCSVRLLNPQTYISKMHYINYYLQEFFQNFVGANVYLTPPNSQGFAPHYDDIEAFILQIEGKKHWKLYKPRTDKEFLPRFSSGNFSQDEISDPIKTFTLEAGDLLYFPRGTIHQGYTTDEHSLHVTISMYQKNSWGDLLEILLPNALKRAIEEDVEFRRGLPLHYQNYFGLVNKSKKENNQQRKDFMKTLSNLTKNVFDYLPVDASVDELAKSFQHDALPPILTPEEKTCTVFEDGEKMIENGKVINQVTFSLNTEVKLVRKNILRLLTEDDSIRIYYSVDNSKVYHEEEQQYLEVDIYLATGVEYLIHKYPYFVEVGKVPVEKEEDRIRLISDLWERGLVMTKKPLNNNCEN